MYRSFLSIGTITLLVITLSCSNSHKPSILTGSMKDYSNEDREKKYVADELMEISGIFFLNDGQKMAAVNDEEGKIFILDYSGKDSTRSFVFAGRGDYEDIVMYGDYFYVLEGKGKIFRVPKPGVEDSVTIYRSGIKDADFETMYLDTLNKRIVMICKSCRDFEKNKLMPAYCFDLTTFEFNSEPCYTIDIRKVRKLLKNDGFATKPSAAAIHPRLNKLFIVCSQDGRGLLISDLTGNVEEAIYLDDSVYPQPEGLTFAPNGDMYISNEGLYQPGSIIHYPYKRR